MKKFNLFLITFITVSLLSSCAPLEEFLEAYPITDDLTEVETKVETKVEEKDNTASEDEITSEEDDIISVAEDEVKPEEDNSYTNLDFDFEELGVKPYSYSSDSFELSDNLKEAIVEMFASTKNWKNSDAWKSGWEESFIDGFILNSWYSPDYIASKSVVTKEEAEYIQFSLTGERIYFNSDEEFFFKTSDSSSPFNYTYMESYFITESQDSYWMEAVFVTQYKYINDDGELDIKEKSEKAAVILKENPYSCFDGYSIDKIFIKDSKSDDNEEELFKLLGLIVDEGGLTNQNGLIDYLIAYNLGETISTKTITDKDGSEYTLIVKIPTEKLESFYKEVLGVEKTFEPGELSDDEVGVYCDDDGYCYGINTKGYRNYMVIDSIDKQEDRTIVRVMAMNEELGEEIYTFEFLVYPAKNEFGYSMNE